MNIVINKCIIIHSKLRVLREILNVNILRKNLKFARFFSPFKVGLLSSFLQILVYLFFAQNLAVYMDFLPRSESAFAGSKNAMQEGSGGGKAQNCSKSTP